jgi:hypothetical protein
VVERGIEEYEVKMRIHGEVDQDSHWSGGKRLRVEE